MPCRSECESSVYQTTQVSSALSVHTIANCTYSFLVWTTISKCTRFDSLLQIFVLEHPWPTHKINHTKARAIWSLVVWIRQLHFWKTRLIISWFLKATGHSRLHPRQSEIQGLVGMLLHGLKYKSMWWLNCRVLKKCGGIGYKSSLMEAF